MRRSGQVVLGVVVAFLALCAAGLWLTRARTAPVARPQPWLGPPVAPAPVAAGTGPGARTGGAASTGAGTPSGPGEAPRPGTGGAGTDAAAGPAAGPEVTAPPPPSEGESPATGTLDAGAVRAALAEVAPAVRACFVAAAQRHPGPQEVTVRFTVEAQGLGGRFTDGEVIRTTLQDPLALQCFLDALSRASFPAPRGGARASVEYPLRFAAPEPDAGS